MDFWLPARPGCLLGDWRKMLTGTEFELAKFTKCTLTFSGDIQCPYTSPRAPASGSMMMNSLLAGYSSLNQSTSSQPTSGQGTDFLWTYFLEPGWLVSWDLKPWRSDVGTICHNIFACYQSSFQKNAGAFWSLPLGAMQLWPPLWLSAYVTSGENNLNAPLIPGWSRVAEPSGVSVAEQLASTFSWFSNKANKLWLCIFYADLFLIQFVNFFFPQELSLASPTWVTVLGHTDNIVASSRWRACETKARVLCPSMLL